MRSIVFCTGFALLGLVGWLFQLEGMPHMQTLCVYSACVPLRLRLLCCMCASKNLSPKTSRKCFRSENIRSM
ncbi:hypothetical protein GGS20DRAFT_560702 [Poronia punctata]|nr:hypothetical protein GGS20DRAFT_560702 [Poronia punctata]